MSAGRTTSFVTQLGDLVCHQMYLAPRAITASVTITNAAICTQKLLVKPPVFLICVFIARLPPFSRWPDGTHRSNSSYSTLKGKVSCAALSALRLTLLSPCAGGPTAQSSGTNLSIQICFNNCYLLRSI